MKGAIRLRNCNCDNKRRSRGCMDMAFGRWENYPYYNGPCADVNGCYNRNSCDRDDDERCCRRRRRGQGRDNDRSAIFAAFLPMAVAANGIIPLVAYSPCRRSDFDVNSGLVTVEERGTYLATLNVRVPEGAALDTTITLNVDDASQTTAITEISSPGTGTSAYAAQAIFEADEDTTVALRTSDAISATDPSAQPMFTLSLVRLDDGE